jgi:MFS family permease
MGGFAGALEPLRERPFRLLFLGRSLSAVGDAIVPVAMTFAVLKLGNATDLGIVLGSQWAARTLFLVAGGVWADRLPRQLVMMGADVIRAVVQALLAVAFFTNSARIWELAVASALFGLAGAFFNPASTGLVPSIVSRERLQEANALLGMSRGAVEVAGPVISGLVVATLGFGVVFAVDAASFVASFLCLAAMRLSRVVQRGERKGMLQEALEGFQVLRERRWMVAGLCCDVIFNAALGAYFVLGPVVVKEHFNGAKDWGLMMTTAAIGGLLGSAFVLRVKPKHPLFVGYLVGFATPLMLLALAPPLPLPVLMVGAGLVFWAIVILNAYWATMEQQHVPQEALSRVDSLAWLASIVVMPAAMFVVGPLSAAIGVGTTLVGAAVLASLGLIGVLSVRDVRELSALAPATVLGQHEGPLAEHAIAID